MRTTRDLRTRGKHLFTFGSFEVEGFLAEGRTESRGGLRTAAALRPQIVFVRTRAGKSKKRGAWATRSSELCP